MLFCATFLIFLMCAGSQGDAILFAHLHYRSSEPNVRLPVPFFTGTSELLVKRTLDHLVIAGAVDQYDLATKTPLLAKELKLYSDELLQKSQVRQYIFCKGLYSGLPFKLQSWGGLAAYNYHVIFLDTSLPLNYLPTGLHHELFHYFDWQMGFVSHDPEWLSFNEPQYRYRNYNTESLYSQTEDINFITPYSQASMAEDKAEIYAYLITDSSFIEYRAKRSQVLQRKVDCIKRRLLAFSPEFNKEFWTRIEARPSLLHARETRNDRAFRSNSVTTDPVANQQHSDIHYPAKLYEPEPPMSDITKMCIFVGVMVSPWFILMGCSWVVRRLRTIEPPPSVAVPSQQ